MTEVRASSPSWPKILDILTHFRQAFLKFYTTANQSSHDAVKTLLSYLKEVTTSKGRP